MKVRILPVSTIDDTRTILQVVMRLQKYLEENPIRNLFYIDLSYDENTLAYDVTKVKTSTELDVSVAADDLLIFDNSYIALVDSVGDNYVTIVGDSAQSIVGAKGATGNGIISIAKTGTSGLVDTYTITFTNGTTSTFTVTNGAVGATGNGISSIAKTDTTGLVDTYTITFTNGTITTFTVTNGTKGQDGEGVPTGGTTGQVLKKKSDTDYDTEWDNTSNENLLLNSNFKINQRGKANYTFLNGGYCVDRWYLIGVGTFTVATRTLAQQSQPSEGTILAQLLDCDNEYSFLKGNNVTFSVKINNIIYQVKAVIPTTMVAGATLGSLYSNELSIHIDTISSSILRVYIQFTLAQSYEISYAKLEIGKYATNYIEPNHNAELEKCKFYGEKCATYGKGQYTFCKSTPLSMYLDDTNLYIEGTILFSDKRVAPTLSTSNIYAYIENSTVYPQLTVGTATPSYCRTFYSGAKPSGLNSTYVKSCCLATRSTQLFLDAEIYPS